MDKKYTKATIQKGSDNADFVAVASTAAEDRHGEVVSVEGWDLKQFKNNPVLLWAHDHTEPAVGKATKVWVDKTVGKGGALMIKGKFHEFTDKAKAIKQMVEEGIIQTMSVGFRPIEMEGDTFTKQELLEVSFVNVPANPQAMISAYKSLKTSGF
jgi:HK97 family phage prohead protease